VVRSTWLSIVLFLLLVAPGLLFDLLSERRRVSATESTFREISRVVLASLFFTAVGVLVVGIVRAVHPAWMPDPRLLLRDGHTYVTAHYSAIWWALVAEAGVALGSAFGVDYLIARRKKPPRLRSVSSWQTVLRDECPDGFVPYVRIRQTDGSVLLGHVARYDADLDQANREIILAPPLFAQASDSDAELRAVPPKWQRIVLPGSTVASLTVQYRPKP
jgi:Family of unknown function (DUF6338)